MGQHRDAVLRTLSAQFPDPEAFLQSQRVAPTGPFVVRAEYAQGAPARRLKWVTLPVLLEHGAGHVTVITRLG